MSIFEWVPTLLLIFAVWRTYCFQPKEAFRNLCAIKNILDRWYVRNEAARKKHEARIKGECTKMYISAKIAEKVADRAFNMASSANLGVIAMQKALVQPRLMTKEQLQRNQLAKKQIDEIFSEGDEVLNMLRPVASEEELEVIDKILEDKQRKQMNGEAKS